MLFLLRFRLSGQWICCFAALAATLLAGCGTRPLSSAVGDDSSAAILDIAGLDSDASADFERLFYKEFGDRLRIKTRYTPSVDTVNSQLGRYRQLFQDQASQPDLLQIDNIWPAILADNLIDLKPYFGNEIRSFSPELINNYTVKGRLVALPTFFDAGVLYYRPTLLRKYGFSKPPETWNELEKMSRVIQRGERSRGRKDFWGYVWQGGAYEGLTCNALEWQASANGGTILATDGTIQVKNPRMIAALQRAVSWIGTISPPGEFVYQEQDALNLWNEGQTAFMRNWTSAYKKVETNPGGDSDPFEIAPVPGGQGGQRGTLGGFATSISKYGLKRDLSIAALRELTSEANEAKRAAIAGNIPTRSALRNLPEVMQSTPLHGITAAKVMAGIVARPSLIAGDKYDEVSRAYYLAVNSVLRRREQPEAAMAKLQAQLIRITGFRPSASK